MIDAPREPRLRDSRRLTGINLLADGPGAVLDVDLAAGEDALIGLWAEELGRLTAALGWNASRTAVRRFPGGASLFVSAALDALYAATEVNEWAWASAEARYGGGQPLAVGEGAARLRGVIAEEANPALLALAAAAAAHKVSFATDHIATSVGSGTGAFVVPAGEPLPAPGALDWSAIHDVPTVLVTGSNGKTTTARLLAAVVRAWGRTAGLCTTDNIVVGEEITDTGDWSGPMGARMVLRDRRVEVAILETARGGILRRGLAVERADAAIVTNVAEDHFGEWGIFDVPGIAAVKLVVGRVARRLVLNADDPVLAEAAESAKAFGQLRSAFSWFAVDALNDVTRAHRAGGGAVAFLAGDNLAFEQHGHTEIITQTRAVPVTMDGAARHNTANALGVIALARAINVPNDAIAAGLAAFQAAPGDNAGRGHRYDVGGVTILVDFAHNPHGLRALVTTAEALEAKRRLIILGQAGDRDDDSIRGLARAAWPWRPDRVVLKEMDVYLRGRPPGAVTGLIRDEFRALGAPDALCADAPTELDAVRAALAWAQPGDLLLMPIHAQRKDVLDLMNLLVLRDWKPGQPLPA